MSAGSFFRGVTVATYDGTADLVNPFYEIMHNIMRRLVLRELTTVVEDTPVIVDFGSGTGEEAIHVVEEHAGASVVGIDSSSEMTERLVAKAEARGVSGSIAVLEENLLTVTTPKVLRFLQKSFPSAGGVVDVVMSAVTIHHLDSDGKKAVYQLAFNLLKPGGLFVNADLYSRDSAELSAICFDEEIRAIKRNFEEESLGVGDEKRRRLEEVRDQWLLHYKEDNICEPIEAQERWLAEIGFRHVGSVFRAWQVGVIWARK